MKVLSIRQPWAWLIVSGYKDVENRTWSMHHRGPLLIHAAKGMTDDELTNAAHFVSGNFGIRLPREMDLPRGGIVGVVEALRCVQCPIERPYHLSGWHEEGRFGLYLAHAASLPFHQCKGQLGFFTLDTPMCTDCDDTGTVKHEFLTSRASVGEPCPCALGRWLKTRGERRSDA